MAIVLENNTALLDSIGSTAVYVLSVRHKAV